MMGRKFADASVQANMKSWPFEVVSDQGRPKIRVSVDGEYKTFHPEEISSMVLGALKAAASVYLDAEVTGCVVTVPANFGDSQRQATRDAATIAGLKVLRVINEPTAGALAYGIGKFSEDERNVLIYDFGGGTFDVSILSIEEGIFEVLATSGDTHLGGEDLDARLLAHLLSEFKVKAKSDISEDRKAVRRLRTACEKAKRQLSSRHECTVQLDNLHAGVDFSTTISRARFEQINEDLFALTIKLVDKALENAKLDKDEIHEVVLVGGSTRIPMVQRLLSEYFDNKVLDTSVSPDEAVARGAAVQAALLEGDPSDIIQDVVLVDVTPLSLGVELCNGITNCIIEKNTIIPTKNTVTFYTERDYQNNVIIPVMEGENRMSKNNYELGCFTVTGIPPAKANTLEQSVDVTFEIDADSILHVSAVVNTTNKQTKVQITGKRGRLSAEEIEKLVKTAELNKETDKQEMLIALAKQSLEDYCVNMRARAESNLLVPPAVKQTILAKCAQTLEWIQLHQNEPKESYEDKKEEMEWICLPLK